MDRSHGLCCSQWAELWKHVLLPGPYQTALVAVQRTYTVPSGWFEFMDSRCWRSRWPCVNTYVVNARNVLMVIIHGNHVPLSIPSFHCPEELHYSSSLSILIGTRQAMPVSYTSGILKISVAVHQFGYPTQVWIFMSRCQWMDSTSNLFTRIHGEVVKMQNAVDFLVNVTIWQGCNGTHICCAPSGT